MWRPAARACEGACLAEPAPGLTCRRRLLSQVDRILRAAASGDVFALESALAELDGCDKTAEAARGVRFSAHEHMSKTASPST